MAQSQRKAESSAAPQSILARRPPFLRPVEAWPRAVYRVAARTEYALRRIWLKPRVTFRSVSRLIEWIMKGQRQTRRECRNLTRLGEVLEGHRAALVSVALARTGRLDAAEDIAQEALVRAWERRESLRDPAALRAWLLRIAVNACVAWYRRETRSSLLTEGMERAASAEPVLEEVLRRQTIRDARRALSGLTLKSRVAFLLHVTGYTYAEIADILDLPPAAVRGRIARARERVRGPLCGRLRAALPPKERTDHD